MKLLLRSPWSLWTLFLIWLPALCAQTGLPIKKSRFATSAPAANDALIKANIRVKVGDVYTRTGVDDDVRTLYSTGYFYNIRVATEPVEEGMNLVYVVQGKPVLSEISFVGNKNTPRQIAEEDHIQDRRASGRAQALQRYAGNPEDVPESGFAENPGEIRAQHRGSGRARKSHF